MATAHGDKVKKLIPREPDEPILQEIARLGLTLELGRLDSLATRALRDSSICDYDDDLRAFDDFLKMLGSHQDRIILLDRPPQNSPPVDPKSIVQYLSMKRKKFCFLNSL